MFFQQQPLTKNKLDRTIKLSGENVKIAILGTSGMLGSMVLDVFQQTKHKILTTTRSQNQSHHTNTGCKFIEAEKTTLQELQTLLHDMDWVINCIGMIKPYIRDDNLQDVARAIHINSLFPNSLAQAIEGSKTKIIQIATDCVFSGKTGGYVETDLHDAADVYGKSKSLGEVITENFYHLRVSIIGPEQKTHKSLLDWVLTQPLNASLKGFTNHSWNGITTLQFAKICLGIINHNIPLNHLQHIVPKNSLNKYEMIGCFKKYFNRNDLKVEKFETPQSIHRTLKTNYIDLNRKIWNAAGYQEIPTIEDMIKELSLYSTKSGFK